MSNIEKLKTKIKKVKIDNELITVKRHMKKLQNENRLDLNVKLWGWVFGLIGFLGFLASTSMSITGGLKSHKDLALIAFVIGVIFIQLVVYVICIKETIIKYRFPRYYLIAKAVQFGLLAISINYNYEFYDIKNFWNFLLSVLLEVAIIVITTIGGDFRSLNYQDQKIIENGGLFSIIAMWWFNKLHKLKVKILDEYNQNITNLTQPIELRKNLTISPDNLTSEKIQIEDSQGLGLVKSELSSPVKLELGKVKSELSPELRKDKTIILLKEKNLEELRFEIETYLKENFKEGEVITTGKIREMFDLTESQWKKIKNDLNCVETIGTKLKYKVL